MLPPLPPPRIVFIVTSMLESLIQISFILQSVFYFLVAHQIYGVAHTINSANYMYFKALEKVLSLNHPECISIFTGTKNVTKCSLITKNNR